MPWKDSTADLLNQSSILTYMNHMYDHELHITLFYVNGRGQRSWAASAAVYENAQSLTPDLCHVNVQSLAMWAGFDHFCCVEGSRGTCFLRFNQIWTKFTSDLAVYFFQRSWWCACVGDLLLLELIQQEAVGCRIQGPSCRSVYCVSVCVCVYMHIRVRVWLACVSNIRMLITKVLHTVNEQTLPSQQKSGARCIRQ